MQSKGNQPSASQKRWREAVRELGSIITGMGAIIHHPVGVTAKHNKVKIGHWWVIPLTDYEHDQVHEGNSYGSNSRKEFEKNTFYEVCALLHDHADRPSHEIIDAIQDYHL